MTSLGYIQARRRVQRVPTSLTSAQLFREVAVTLTPSIYRYSNNPTRTPIPTLTQPSPNPKTLVLTPKP